jgi:elongator complex protein 2
MLTQNLPNTANLPVLGLSNKESTSENDAIAPSTFIDTLTTPPLEDHLSRYTLSPELEKLYAHPSEIIALSTSHDGKFIASTCKSSTPTTSLIRIFSADTFSEVAVLKGHSLTITKVNWSKDDKWLVSISRDRGWIVYDTETWTAKHSEGKAHARILWDVSFSPRGDSFVTCSRDKTCKLWSIGDWKCFATVKLEEAVMACAFLTEEVFVVGLENGRIYIVGKGNEGWRVVSGFEEGYVSF